MLMRFRAVPSAVHGWRDAGCGLIGTCLLAVLRHLVQ
jgi:hypothetical protein